MKVYHFASSGNYITKPRTYSPKFRVKPSFYPSTGCKGHGNDGHSHEQSNIVGRKTDRGLNIVSNSNENPPSSKPIKCSICSSMAPDNLTPEQRKQINPVGQECIDSPEKFIRDCDEWRSSLLSERPFGSINRTVHFTGCYKSTFTYDYDFEGN